MLLFLIIFYFNSGATVQPTTWPAQLPMKLTATWQACAAKIASSAYQLNQAKPLPRNLCLLYCLATKLCIWIKVASLLEVRLAKIIIRSDEILSHCFLHLSDCILPCKCSLMILATWLVNIYNNIKARFSPKKMPKVCKCNNKISLILNSN